MKTAISILVLMLSVLKVHACVWDAETLTQEKWRSHDLATVILGNPPAPEDPQKLRDRIQSLEANRYTNSPDWWNNLAGAYIRLGQPEKAVKLLEPVISEFPNDYGIHANLGTAYHLLGRYTEAEKEIARDLEINPDAHFGLEKYHLALLQYLVRDDKYKSRHLYVDEFTASFFGSDGVFYYSDQQDRVFKNLADFDFTNGIVDAENFYQQFVKTNKDERYANGILGELAALDEPPTYRTNWNLATGTNFEAGVIYMAQMNPKEPACFEMLGIAAWKKRDYNLAVSAFEKAIKLGSPQVEVLQIKIDGLRDFIRKSHKQGFVNLGVLAFLSLIPLVILYYIYTKIRDYRRKLKTTS